MSKVFEEFISSSSFSFLPFPRIIRREIIRLSFYEMFGEKFVLLSFFLSCIVRELDQLKVEEFKYPGIPRITKHLNCTVLWITRWKNATTLEYNHSRVGKFLFIVSMFRGEKPNWFENRLLARGIYKTWIFYLGRIIDFICRQSVTRN